VLGGKADQIDKQGAEDLLEALKVCYTVTHAYLISEMVIFVASKSCLQSAPESATTYRKGH